jgi:SNF2 family DNA or RNA helicase
MPVKLEVVKNTIHASITKNSNNFSDLVAFFHAQGCTYNKKNHYYVVPVKRYENIYEALSEITLISIDENTQHELSLLPTKVGTQIQKYRIPFAESDLKVSPIEGKAPYQKYQFEDIQKLMSTNRHLLFNEMGTGKSYELFSAVDLYSRMKGLNKIVILTSNSGTYNLYMDLQRFSHFTQDQIEIGGVKNRKPFDNNSNVIIMSYRSFLLVSDEYRGNKCKIYKKCPIPMEQWLNGDRGMLILDESHQCSNPQARQSKVVDLIASYFYYIYCATGTPADVEWKYYSQLKCMDPALVKNMSFTNWSHEYFEVGDRYSRYNVYDIKPEKAEELQNLVKAYCTRRFALDVLQLPDNYIRPYYVSFTDEHKTLYRAVVLEVLQKIQEQQGALEARAVVSSFQTAMLAIDMPQLLLRSEYSPEVTQRIEAFKFKNHSKMEALLELIEKHKGSKIIIWTSHPRVAAALEEILKKEHLVLVLNGESKLPRKTTRDEYKKQVIDKFENEGYNILIAGEQVLNTSVSIIKANVQIYFDTDFNYTTKSQSGYRIHRIGQTQNCYTYDLVIGSSLDVVRYKNLQDKDFINRNFLNEKYIDLKQAQLIYNMEVDY